LHCVHIFTFSLPGDNYYSAKYMCSHLEWGENIRYNAFYFCNLHRAVAAAAAAATTVAIMYERRPRRRFLVPIVIAVLLGLVIMSVLVGVTIYRNNRLVKMPIPTSPAPPRPNTPQSSMSPSPSSQMHSPSSYTPTPSPPFNQTDCNTQIGLATTELLAFAVLAGSGVTAAAGVHSTTITGDTGEYPLITPISNIPAITLIGIDHLGSSLTQTAMTQITAVVAAALNKNPTTYVAGLGGGQTLKRGIYHSDSSLDITGELILDGQHDETAAFTFFVGSALTVNSFAYITLINGAKSCNIFWMVGSSATLGTSSSMQGNVIAAISISMRTSATITGRLICTHAISLDTNQVTIPGCAPDYALLRTCSE
jgi:hypothetical protein